MTNNPFSLEQQQQLLEENETVARAKAEAGFNTNIYAIYGLDQSSNQFSEVYKNPDNSQRFRLGVSIPIVDWGRRKGRYQMAQYNRGGCQSNH